MKQMAIMNKISKAFHKTTFKIQKHSPEILIVAGVTGVVASAVLACRATLKVDAVVEDTKAKINKINVATEKGVTEAGQEYTAEDGKKDLSIVYAQTGVKFLKLYGLPVALGTLSLASIIASHNILSKRNAALAAAYAAVDTSFKTYRDRVIERFGEGLDKELKYNVKPKEIEETVVDEKGKEKKVTVLKNYVDPTDVSEYARFFEKYTRDEKGNVIINRCWEENNEYNLLFLKAQQQYANDLLRSKGRLFLNEVYEMLGLPRSKAGQIMGWVYDSDAQSEDDYGDHYVDFGILASSENYSDFIYNDNEGILLDFNVDGNVWDLLQ